MGVKRSRNSDVWQTGESGCAGAAAAGESRDPGWSSDLDFFDRQEYSDRLFSSSQGSTCTDDSVGSSSGGDGGDEPPANTKRTQRKRITTEAHQRTVAMMMAASRELWMQQQQNPEQNTLEEEARQSQLQELQKEPAGCCFFQRAFW